MPALAEVDVGLLHLFLLHTSAALSINENADPDVRADLERWASRAVPDGAPYYAHRMEGPDDMPGHVKCSLFGCELSVPVQRGCLRLGTWQGIYLCEHRRDAGTRRVVATLRGESARRANDG